jgi:hypothetical protein
VIAIPASSGTIKIASQAASAGLVNAAGATLRAVGVGGFITLDYVDNLGSLIFSPDANSASDSVISGPLTNFGSLQLTSGRLDLYNGGVSSASAITVAANAALTFGKGDSFVIDGGAYEVAGATLIAQFADLRFTASTRLDSTVINDGTLEAVAGTLSISQPVLGSAGVLQIDAGATLSLSAQLSPGQTLHFAGANALLALASPASVDNPVTGLTVGDRIDLEGITASSASLGNGQIVLSNNGATVLAFSTPGLTLPANAQLVVNSDGYGGTLLSVAVSPGGATGVTTAAQELLFSLQDPHVIIKDSATNIDTYLDNLQALAASGTVSAIQLTDGGTPQLTITLTQLAEDNTALQAITSPYALLITGISAVNAAIVAAEWPTLSVAVSDDAAQVAAHLDALTAVAAAHKLAAITLSDGGVPTLDLTPRQVTADAAALQAITNNFQLVEEAASPDLTLSGLAGHGNTVLFADIAADYTIVAAGDGTSLSVTDSGTGRSSVDQLSQIQALQFSDVTEIVATAPGVAGAVTSGNVAELYGAAFGREPDVAGLAYYEHIVQTDPALPLTTFAQWFLASPEYVAAHSYPQTAAGDAQFITDLYANLLHRAPETGAVAYYQAVVQQVTQGLTAGSAAFTAAESTAHATILADVASSTEFLSDVQITAAAPAGATHWLLLI